MLLVATLEVNYENIQYGSSVLSSSTPRVPRMPLILPMCSRLLSLKTHTLSGESAALMTLSDMALDLARWSARALERERESAAPST